MSEEERCRGKNVRIPLLTGWISLLVPDPALVDESSGRPPLLVGELLAGGGDALSYLALEKFELVVRVDADELGVETATGAWRVVVVEVLSAVRVHDEQVLRAAVRQPVVYVSVAAERTSAMSENMHQRRLLYNSNNVNINKTASISIQTACSLRPVKNRGTRKRGNCECIATWGRPSHATPVHSFPALLTMPFHVWSRWTYPLPYYSVFAADTLLYAVTLTFDPVTLIFDLWPWTFAMYRLWRDETMYLIWTQSINPWRSYCDFSVWPSDLEHCVTCCPQLWDNFLPSLTFDNLSVPEL